MSTRTTAPNYQCQTNGHDLIGFNVNRDNSSKLSMPNQWARSHRLQCQQGIQDQTINATNQWARSHRLQCQQGHKIKLSMPQTNGHNLTGFNVSRDTRSNYQCQTNGHNLIGFNVNKVTIFITQLSFHFFYDPPSYLV